MRILVVEDEPKLANYVQKGLTENGHVVDVAHDGIDGAHLAVNGDYDLVVLDIMLPGIDGFGVLKAIKDSKNSKDTAVLMLTARDSVEDRVSGLREGADDYLVKPFAFSELLARLTALQRRGIRSASSLAASRIVVGDVELDLIRRKALRAGKLLDLTAKEFLLLSLLMRRQGEVLSRTVLAEQVWDMNFDSDTNVVEVAIRRLRTKLDDPFETKLLKTVRGMGYVLEQP
ncbi:heavy metal response regulator transcription factor [Herbaspirillum sp. SJZ107]|uniref:heavy metal response regulator transcription factor n=1 Tax=Herbaspirillum sp. SJZ107 TaxID=2572881 RepID=UPI00115480A1|nr:heavy metal response regulator transcription factor [Herbaspirillum sp. SJZ107]TQK08286.1 two-component system copper resistance phosphate regulon response regulator CusR [Herbaspirillum sp. SJZ107]